MTRLAIATAVLSLAAVAVGVMIIIRAIRESGGFTFSPLVVLGLLFIAYGVIRFTIVYRRSRRR